MKHLLSILVFTLAAIFSSSAAGGYHTGTDADTGSMMIMLERGHELVAHLVATPAEVDSAIALAQETLQMSRDRKWLTGEGESWLIFSYAFDKKRNLRERKRCLDSAMAIFKGMSGWRRVGECTLLQATFESVTDSLQLMHRVALEKEALSYALRVRDSLLTALCYYQLGYAHIWLRGYGD